ncbi:SHOCT domain-containing protein [Sphaerisporangium perillae]|uniref:SHOCT domain-containing protein n=1 Tax=Sphaerisporangium perillae TaxID=2935860 RepID=UPI00200E1D66|nr:SHOCT domain-containing protein [Sphaerisporangium perillae]
MPYAHWAPGPWWPIIPLFWALFWVTLVVMVFRARGRGWGPFAGASAGPPWAGRATASPTASAEKILAERYAKGELSDEEYFERISVLKGGSA